MKPLNYLSLLFLSFFCFIQSGQAGFYNWAKRLGDASTNIDVGKSITSDKNGNVYVTGLFQGTADFDPGNGVFNLVTAGSSQNIFFAKYNANGNFIWAKQIGDANLSKGIDIKVDDNSDVYLLADFEQSISLDFDPGTGTGTVLGQGNKSIAFAKYDTDGNFIWAKSISGSGDCLGATLLVNSSGNIYISGAFSLVADMDPSGLTANLTAIGTNNGFFAMYNNQGSYQWAKQLTAAGGNSEIKRLTQDNVGNLYITGFYQSNCDFDPDGVAQFIRTNDGNSDFYVGCYNEFGIFKWAIALDGTSEDIGNAIGVDDYHNVYVAGTFTDSLETDPSPVDNYLVSQSAGISDNFVAKYDENGAAVWAFRLGNAQVDYCNSLAVDQYGTIFICGAFTGTVDFDPGVATEIINSGGTYNSYLASYDTDANFAWVKDLGGNNYDEALNLSIDEDINVYMTGYFADSVDFDASPTDTAILIGGVADIFMIKHSPEPPIKTLRPFDNATWLVGATYPIRWESKGVDSIRVERQDINQIVWELLGDVAASPNVLLYNLAAINPLVDYTLRISDLKNKTVYATSIVRVKFSPQLNYPTGGEVFTGDSIITVNWFASGTASAYFDLKYSTNGGTNWLTMRDSVQTFFDNDSSFYIGNYNWKVPRLISSSNCKVGIFAVNQATPLFSSNAFTIAPSNPTSFQVLSPNGGEQWERKRNYYITWTGVSMPPVVVLQYSLDGVNFISIDTVANTGYYNWRVRDVLSSNCYIRVGNFTMTIFDESNAPFEIVNQSFDEAELTAPLGGEKWCEGTQQYIRWTSNISGKITLWYKAGSGSDIFIDTVNASDGLYYWTVPNNPSGGNRIRIEPADGSGSNLSTSGTFVICPNSPSIQVNYPNGGDSFYPNCYVKINWGMNLVDTCTINYSIDNGANWNQIASNVTQSPYYWLVPDSASNNCLIRIFQNSNTTLADESNFVFTILPPFTGLAPTLSTNNLSIVPCKKDTIAVSFSVTGLNFDTTNTFYAQLSDSSGSFSGNITTIGELKDSVSGTISCIIPPQIPNSALYQIRVVANYPPVIGTPSASFVLNTPEFTFRDSVLYTFLPNAAIAFPAIGPLATGETIEWKFGDGSTSTSLQPIHVYNRSGIYDVGVKVSNSIGCITTKVNVGYVRVDKRFPNAVLNANKNITVTGISFKNDSTGSISYSDGSVKYTNDNGLNWYAVQSTGLSDVTSIKMKNATDWIVVGSNGGVRKTNNRGLSWDTVTFNNGVTPTVKLNAVDFSGPLAGYIVGDSGKVFRFNGTQFNPAPQFTNVNLYTVFDDGTNAFVAGDSGKIVKRSAGVWTHKNSGLNTTLRSLIFASANPLKGYAVGDQGRIIQSSDAGETWSPSLSGADVNFSSIACSENGDSAWAVGEAGIIYQTTDFGQSWERFSKGATSSNTRVTFRKPRGYIAGTSGSLRTFFPVNNQSTLGIKLLSESIAENVFLYPNPAKDVVTLQFTSEKMEQVIVMLKDANGKDIAVPINQFFSGKIVRQIQLENLKDGIYFLHIRKGEQYLIKKLVVVK